jgi:hypothetical protein
MTGEEARASTFNEKMLRCERRCFVSNEVFQKKKGKRFVIYEGGHSLIVAQMCFDLNERREGVFRLELKKLRALVSFTAKQTTVK